MKTKLLALALCLALLIVPFSAIGVAADTSTDVGYTLDEESKTYTVTTADGLLAVVALLNAGKLDYNVTLGANIDMADKTWTPIGKVNAKSDDATKVASFEAYKGTFDGDGHTLSNVKADVSETKSVASSVGLMAAADGAVIKDLTLVGVEFKAYEYAGALSGTTTGASITVENVHIRESKIEGIRKNYTYVGGFFGKSDATAATVTNCTIVVTLVSSGRAGGVFGGEGVGSSTNGRVIDISNTIVAGTFTVKETTSGGVGGFLGYHSTIPMKLTNCVSIAEMTSSGTKGSVAMNSNKLTLQTENCVLGGHLVGKLSDNSNSAITTLTNTYIYSLDATETEMAISQTPFEVLTKDGTTLTFDTGVKINDTDTTWTDAKLPVINNKEALRSKVVENFAGNTYISETTINELLGHEHAYTVELAASAYLKSAADCTNAAVYYKSCTCGSYVTDATFTHGDALGHSPSDKWSDGDDEHWHTCELCLVEKSDVAAHTYGDWTITRDSTTTREGERAKTCTVCGHEITEKIAKKSPETEPPVTEPASGTEKKEGGCGSSILGTGVITIVSIGAAAICFKRKKND